MTKVLLIFFLIFFFALPIFAQSVNTAWVRRYNGLGNGEDRAKAIALDNSGNVYVTGYSSGSGTYRDYTTIKYYPNGDTAWVRRYNGSGNWLDEAYAIAIDGSENIYVTGYSYYSGTYFDYATIKYYPNGDTAWVRRFNGPQNDYDQAYAIAVDDSNNIYVTGGSGDGGIARDYATIKYNPNGNTVWERRYDGPQNGWDEAYAITVDNFGNVYVTGTSDGSGPGGDYVTIKYYSNGDTAWVRRYSGPGNADDGACAIAVDGSGDIYVTGFSWGSGTGSDYATIKYYPNGDTAWLRRYNGPGYGYDYATALALDGSDNLYVTGYSYGINYDYATIKYCPNGDTAWVRRYNAPGYEPGYDIDKAYAIAVDDSNNVYVTGYSYDSGTSGDFVTIKYYPNGDTAWVRRYDGPGDSTDYASAVAVDSVGNVYVTGWSYDDVTNFDYATIKYVKTPNDIKDETGGPERPSEFALSQNYPNPFNSLTTINYSVERVGLVRLTIYNILGQQVGTLVNERKQKGSYSVEWDGHNDKRQELPSGAYFYILKVDDNTSSKKMILLK
jgi:uncharacterized delta-60 repeat protein